MAAQRLGEAAVNDELKPVPRRTPNDASLDRLLGIA
jgi:hypothetical protein